MDLVAIAIKNATRLPMQVAVSCNGHSFCKLQQVAATCCNLLQLVATYCKLQLQTKQPKKTKKQPKKAKKTAEKIAENKRKNKLISLIFWSKKVKKTAEK